MELDELVDRPGQWLSGEGPESDVVISSRIRLARNLRDYNFCSRLSNERKAEVQEKVRQVIEANQVVDNGMYLPLDDAHPVDCRFLMERHLISREHQEGEGPRGVAVGAREMVSIMVNEEDHLRLQVLVSGLQPLEGWRISDKVDDALEASLEYAFSPELGYLTACPTNVGTGMRVSVMLHLPALHLTRKIDQIFSAVAKLNLAVRGLHGEGTEAQGHFYQISNQTTLGKSEERIVKDVSDVIPEIVKWELKAREALLQSRRRNIEDKVWRAWGILNNSRVIDSNEAMTLLSDLRMGAHMKMLQGLDLHTISEMFVFIQPAHLQKHMGRELDAEERDAARADYIRSKLPSLN